MQTSVQQKTTDASSPKSRGGKEGGGKKEKKKGQQGKDKKTVSLQNFQSDGAAGEEMLEPSQPTPPGGGSPCCNLVPPIINLVLWSGQINSLPYLLHLLCLWFCHHDNVVLIIGLMSVHKIIIIILPDTLIEFNRLSMKWLSNLQRLNVNYIQYAITWHHSFCLAEHLGKKQEVSDFLVPLYGPWLINLAIQKRHILFCRKQIVYKWMCWWARAWWTLFKVLFEC